MSDEIATPEGETDTINSDVAETPAAEITDEPADITQIAEPETEPEAPAKLRREAKNLRDRLKTAENRAEDLARRLHSELTRSSGKLADPTDLAYDAAHLDDTEAHTAAIESLLETKPHLRSRVPSAGNVGQGAKDNDTTPPSFISHLKTLV